MDANRCPPGRREAACQPGKPPVCCEWVTPIDQPLQEPKPPPGYSYKHKLPSTCQRVGKSLIRLLMGRMTNPVWLQEALRSLTQKNKQVDKGNETNMGAQRAAVIPPLCPEPAAVKKKRDQHRLLQAQRQDVGLGRPALWVHSSRPAPSRLGITTLKLPGMRGSAPKTPGAGQGLGSDSGRPQLQPALPPETICLQHGCHGGITPCELGSPLATFPDQMPPPTSSMPPKV